MVSRRTYLRHRAAHSRAREPSNRRYSCHCSEFPSGHNLLSKSSYYRHLDSLRDSQLLEHDQEAPIAASTEDGADVTGEEEAREISSSDELPDGDDPSDLGMTLLLNTLNQFTALVYLFIILSS